MVCCINGQFYLRDMGFVHNSRIKLDNKCEVQIQKGSVVDLGKVVHYHFDKVLHNAQPSRAAEDGFYILRPDREYEIDNEDFPYLRARPVWVSQDENVDNIQNEIHVTADGQKQVNTVGRSMKRDIQIKLKAVSADHCAIQYRPAEGWTITEKGKEKSSSNGTYIFLKSHTQMKDHMPSDLIPVHNDMTISFVNYELKVRLESKTDEELSSQSQAMLDFFTAQDAEFDKQASSYGALNLVQVEEQKVPEPAPVVEQPPPVVEEKKPEPVV